jgi:hypothetical protein
MLSQIRKSAQHYIYTGIDGSQLQKGPFFSQRESFDVDEEADSENGELDTDDEDISGFRDVGRTPAVESTKGV